MRSRAFILAVLLLASLAAAAGAIAPPWTPLGPFGGAVSHLTADPTRSGTLYATTPRGIFKTLDAGAHWTALSLDMATTPVAVDPVHPSTLYVGVLAPRLLLKSTDGGASWFPSGTGLPENNVSVAPASVTIDPSNPRRLLLDYLGTVWRSADAGASWQAASSGLPPSSSATPGEVAFAARPAGTAFATTTAGLYRSFDAGLSWQRLDHGLPAAGVLLLALAPSDPKTAYVSLAGLGLYGTADGGVSWRHVSVSSSLFNRSLAVSARSPRTLYAGTAGGLLFRSTDGGAHWSPLSGVSGVASVAFDASLPQRVYAGTGAPPLGGVSRSDDGGASWTRWNQGMTGLVTPLLAVDPGDADELWTTVGAALFHSANAGARWARVTSPSPSPLSWLAAGASGDLFATVPFTISHNQTVHDAWKSADGGASWKQVLDSASLDTLQIRVAPSDPATVYAAGFNLATGLARVYRSTDRGETWEPRPSGGTPFCGFLDLAVAPSSAAVVYVSGSRFDASSPRCEPAVLRSGDGGATWGPAGSGLPASTVVALAVDPRDPDLIYAGTFMDGVWKSADGGRTWSLASIALAGRRITRLIADDSGRLFVVVDGKVDRSDDGGVTWQGWNRGLRTSLVFSLAAAPGGPGRIHAATANGVWVVSGED